MAAQMKINVVEGPFFKACHPTAAAAQSKMLKALEQQAFIALRILYGYSYGPVPRPESFGPSPLPPSSRKIRVLSDRNKWR